METLNRLFNKNRIVKDYKRVVRFYNLWSLLTESKAAAKVLELAEIKDGQKILEIACGTGVVFEKIVKQNPNGINIGVDLSPDMLKKTKLRLRKKDYTNYEIKEGNVLQLDFPNNSFDLLLNNFMVDLMPEENFDKIASEFYRLLKPNGIALVSTFSKGKKIINKIWLFIAVHLPNLLTGCRPVSFAKHLSNSGFTIEKELKISQNTFPSEVIKAVKQIDVKI